MPDPIGSVPDKARLRGVRSRLPKVGSRVARRVGYDPKSSRHHCGARRASQDLREAGGRSCSRDLLPAGISGWLILGWAKVLPHLPNAATMPKLFRRVWSGWAIADKPKDYAYSTTERTDLVGSDLAGSRRPVDDAGCLRLFLTCRLRASAAPA